MKYLLFAALLSSATLIAQTPAGDAANGTRIAAIGLNAQGLIHYVRAPGGAMPAYTDKVITDQELTDVWAYLQTLPKAKPAKDIPLLNALQKK
jgi:hypothetical protein